MTTNLSTTAKLGQSLKARTLSDLVRVKTADNAMLLLDVSGSMAGTMRNGKTRERGLQETVVEITKDRDVKMIAFGGASNYGFGDNSTQDREGGAYVVTRVPSAGGGTPLHDALTLAKRLNASKVVVISDGMPNNPTRAFEAAAAFGGVIDVVFVGDPGEAGEEFLRELAKRSGGTEFNGDLGAPKELGGQIMGLLGGGDDDDEDAPKGAIQL